MRWRGLQAPGFNVGGGVRWVELQGVEGVPGDEMPCRFGGSTREVGDKIVYRERQEKRGGMMGWLMIYNGYYSGVLCSIGHQQRTSLKFYHLVNFIHSPSIRLGRNHDAKKTV